MNVGELIFAVMSGGGLLALSVGAFGVLDAYNKRGIGERRVDWLIGLFALGVLMNVTAYTMIGKWYVAAPLALMLIPAEVALEKRGKLFRNRAKIDA